MPVVKTRPGFRDRLGTCLARTGINRNSYLVSPGLYAVGNPDDQSPVVVSANYKLSFDKVRYALAGHDTWLLVLDTCGINVWCAAGKGTFSTEELLKQVALAALDQVVSHRRLIVPQLGATGISAHLVKKKSGFSVRYGPVEAKDLPEFLDRGLKAETAMRRVNFSLAQRIVLIPVEMYLFARSAWWGTVLIFLLSGIGPDFFSLERTWQRGIWGCAAFLTGIVSGAVIVPLFLPWLPGRMFSVKGVGAGFLSCLCFFPFIPVGAPVMDKASLLLLIVLLSSYLGMNFTGSTPFTSPSGVEREMKRSMPVQLVFFAVIVILWVLGPFIQTTGWVR